MAMATRRRFSAEYKLKILREAEACTQPGELGEEVRASRLVRVEYLTLDWIEAAWVLFKRYGDKDFSFTDCTSFVLMRKLGLREAPAFDGHFTQAGFAELRSRLSSRTSRRPSMAPGIVA